MNNEKLIRVGITQGDTNGIGPEVILKVMSDPQFMELCTPIIYGSPKVMAYHRKAIEMQPLSVNNILGAEQAKDGAVNLVDVHSGEEVKIELGQTGKQAGNAAFKALEAAVADLKHGLIDVLVTAPIHTENIRSNEFQFNGHTDYLQASLGEGEPAMMMLCHEGLRVALVTTHLPIAQVPAAITQESVLEKIRLLDKALTRDFGIVKPRIAVLALNPHAGENGLLGHEEAQVIAPAIEQAYGQEKILCFGPYAADGFFGNRQYRQFDAVLAMYHDQGLAPFKTLAMDEGVNYTAGLPYVRTSPDHGTGYDIAGKGVASEQSMRQAIYAAIDIYRSRLRHDEMNANPLRKQYHDKGKDNVGLDLTKDEEE